LLFFSEALNNLTRLSILRFDETILTFATIYQ